MLAVLAAAVALSAASQPYVAPDGRTEAQLIAAHVLPDRSHPGVINPAVNASNLKSTVCVAGWTATVRPPTSYTNKIRAALTPPGHRPADGELDHRLSIEDTGHPSDPANLWWQAYDDKYGARRKDVVETKIHRLLCAGKIGVDEARNALLGNWLTAYERYVGPLPK